MKYVGGKYRISKWVCEHIARTKGNKTVYIEPFVGMAGVYMNAWRMFDRRIISDAHPDLILLLQAIAAGWEPPLELSKGEYYALKSEEPSAMRGLAGFGASYGGVFFSGHVGQPWHSRDGKFARDFYQSAREQILALRTCLAGATIVQRDYRDTRPHAGCFVYCDPPYAGTTGYSVGAFDSEEFWSVAESWSALGATVLVSEESAPHYWECIASAGVNCTLKSEKSNRRVERLYMLGG